MKAYELETRLINFASRIKDMAEALPQTFGARHLGAQIIRSATSPALNYREAQAAESKDDFIHKMKICHARRVRQTLRAGKAEVIPAKPARISGTRPAMNLFRRYRNTK